jgi:trimethylamine---corrinoid protein Co-methyltransferase
MTVRMTWLTEEEKEAIYGEALGVLERVGMRFSGSEALHGLEEAGARVDRATGVVRFPAELVEGALATCPRDVLMAGARAEKDVLLDGGKSFFNVSGCAAKTLDRNQGDLRPSTLTDLREGTVVLDATPELDVVWTFLTASDVPLERRELVEHYVYLTETEKPIVLVDCPTEVDAVRRIFEVVAGDLASFRARPRVSVLCAVRAPLEVNGRLLDLTTEFARLGAPIWVYSMPISGATAPITLAGAVTQMWAEILGTTTAIQTVAPGASIIACCGPGILDMRTTTMSLGCLENSVMGAACVEIGHHLGLPVHNAGLATDAKSAGMQAGYEKGLKVLAATATGADIISGGFGFLDACSTFYLPMIPIDAEIAAMAKAMVRGFEVSPDTLMCQAIQRVGIAGNFLGEKETRLRVQRGEHFVPWIASRQAMDQWLRAGRSELETANERVDQILASRDERGPYLASEQRGELARICGVAAEEVGVWS